MADEDSSHATVEETSQAAAIPGAGSRLLSRLIGSPEKQLAEKQLSESGVDKVDDDSFVLPFLWPLW